MSNVATTIDMDGNPILTNDQAPVSVQGQLKNLSSNLSQVFALVMGAGAIALIVALFMWANKPEYRVLYSNLSEADGGRIITELDKLAVPYRFSGGGNAVLVPADQVHMLRLRLAEQNLPGGGDVGFELLENQPFGISQFVEQINFQRGLEGELVRSIKTLDPVADARIHLAVAKSSVFIRDRAPTKASVLVTLHRGRALNSGQVNAIMHMVASSVPRLSPENITVLDQAGNLLSKTVLGGDSAGSAPLEHTKKVEDNYQARIENTLIPLFGRENIAVQVAAQINFSSREETSERYAPNQNANSGNAAIRSAQWSSIGADAGFGGGASGVPGAFSNTPSIASESEGGKKGKAGKGGSSADNVQRESTVNYEVDHNIIHTRHQTATIERLTTAVVVNYRPGEDADGNPVQVPLSAEELAQITLLVKQAMGFSAERGDRVEVVNSQFVAVPEVPEQIAPPYWQTSDGQQLISSVLRYLVAAIAAFIVYRLLLKPLLKRVSELPQAQIIAAMRVPELPDGTAQQEEEEDTNVVRKSLEGRTRKTLSYEQNVAEIKQAANDDPRLIAMIVRTWMAKE